MGIKFANYTRMELTLAINASITTLEVDDASSLPALGASDYIYLTLFKQSDQSKEIVKCTGISSNTLTVVRGQDGTTAQAFSVSDSVEPWLNKGALEAIISEGSLSGAQGLENEIIDGQFNHWTNGTSFTSDGYGPDMWGFSLGGGTGTFSRQAFTIGQTDVPDNPKYYAQLDMTVDGTGVELLYQRQKDCTKYSGQNFTKSFYARVTSGTLDVTPAVRQNFGAGGSPSTEVETQASSAVTLTTSWQKFEATIAVPSVSGKTIGTDVDSDYFEFVLLIDDSATTFTAEVSNVGGLEGVDSFDGPWLSAGEEKKRSFEYLYYISTTLVSSPTVDNADRVLKVFYPVEMVQEPTITHTGASGWSAGPVWVSTKNIATTGTNASSSTTIASVATFTADARY